MRACSVEVAGTKLPRSVSWPASVRELRRPSGLLQPYMPEVHAARRRQKIEVLKSSGLADVGIVVRSVLFLVQSLRVNIIAYQAIDA